MNPLPPASNEEREHPGYGVPMQGVEVPADGAEHELVAERPSTMEERAARGAAFLDDFEPGWADRIDLENLDLYSTHSCVCGQLGGSWGSQLRRWFPEMPEADRLRWSYKLGFSGIGDVQSMTGDQMRFEYVKLTDLWRELIAARRAAGAR